MDQLRIEKKCEKCGSVIEFWKDGQCYVVSCPCQLVDYKRLVLGERFANIRLEDIKPRTSRQAEIKCMFLKKPMDSYFLWGELNTGKSHFLASLYDYAVDHDYLHEARFFTDRELKRDLIDFEMDRLGDRIPTFSVDFLRQGVVRQVFWDDIGKVKISEFVQQEIFAIVDEIFRRNLKLACTSNFSLDELGEILGNPIVRRITDICKVIKF